MQGSNKCGHITGVIVVLILAATVPAEGTEKHAVAQAAQVVIVGTFTPSIKFPWLDGWHLSGKVTVHEVLYGGHISREITVRFPCKWNSCPTWPPPQYPEGLLDKGLWFLRRVGMDSWESPLGSNDVGFRNISERSYWENYIRRYKQ